MTGGAGGVPGHARTASAKGRGIPAVSSGKPVFLIQDLPVHGDRHHLPGKELAAVFQGHGGCVF